jgi:hypothetical protein
MRLHVSQITYQPFYGGSSGMTPPREFGHDGSVVGVSASHLKRYFLLPLSLRESRHPR